MVLLFGVWKLDTDGRKWSWDVQHAKHVKHLQDVGGGDAEPQPGLPHSHARKHGTPDTDADYDFCRAGWLNPVVTHRAIIGRHSTAKIGLASAIQPQRPRRIVHWPTAHPPPQSLEFEFRVTCFASSR